MSAKWDGIAAELISLKNENGLIVPREVVSWARRHKQSQLHQELEWDDGEAAERWRENQVRTLIAVHIVEEHGVRRFVSLSIDRVHGGGYRELPQVMSRQDLRECMLADALADLERLQQKYALLQELNKVWEAAGAVKKRRGRPPKAA